MQKKMTYVEGLDCLSQVVDGLDADRPISTNISAADLLETVDTSLGDQGHDIDVLLQAAKDYVAYNPDVSKPEFFKQLYSGLNAPALFGDWVTAISNATMHTYQVSPVATLMELELIKQLNALIGFNDGDGVMVSGGSQANLVAMMMARQKAVPDVKEKGTQGHRLVAYTSDQAHYSSQKAANVLGIGQDNLIAVESDDEGRMKPEALKQAIETSLSQGHTPFFISLTAGTTVAGAYDPIEPCVKIARAFDIWIHVDGAWGGPILFSDKHKHLMQGCEQVDSVGWDAHKLMNVSMTAAMILVRQKGHLRQATSGGGGNYLFHQDADAAYNLGELSIQCGRRADALKVWMSWKAIGNSGFAAKIDYLQDLRAYCVDQIKRSDKFKLLHTPSYTNILFQHKPAGMDDEAQLRAHNIAICKAIKASGKAFVDYASLHGRSGVRLILGNDDATKDTIDNLLALCEKFGDQLAG